VGRDGRPPDAPRRLPQSPLRSSSGSLAMLAAIRCVSSRQQISGSASAGFIRIIDVAERLPISIANDEARTRYLQGPKAAGSGGANDLSRPR
jgi:hypothetical protein